MKFIPKGKRVLVCTITGVVLILLFTTIFIIEKSDSSLFAEEKEFTEKEIYDIAEAAYRYHFDCVSEEDKLEKFYYVSILGKDPKKEFFKRFTNHKPALKNGSEFVQGLGAKYDIKKIQRLDESIVLLITSRYVANQSADSRKCIFKKVNGKWEFSDLLSNTMS